MRDFSLLFTFLMLALIFSGCNKEDAKPTTKLVIDNRWPVNYPNAPTWAYFSDRDGNLIGDVKKIDQESGEVSYEGECPYYITVVESFEGYSTYFTTVKLTEEMEHVYMHDYYEARQYHCIASSSLSSYDIWLDISNIYIESMGVGFNGVYNSVNVYDENNILPLCYSGSNAYVSISNWGNENPQYLYLENLRLGDTITLYEDDFKAYDRKIDVELPAEIYLNDRQVFGVRDNETYSILNINSYVKQEKYPLMFLDNFDSYITLVSYNLGNKNTNFKQFGSSVPESIEIDDHNIEIDELSDIGVEYKYTGNPAITHWSWHSSDVRWDVITDGADRHVVLPTIPDEISKQLTVTDWSWSSIDVEFREFSYVDNYGSFYNYKKDGFKKPSEGIETIDSYDLK